MANITHGSLEVLASYRSGNHLWKRTSPTTDWVWWNGTAWVIIAATLRRHAEVDMTQAAAVAIPSPVAGDVVSHNSSATPTFAIGAGWGITPGTLCNHTDDFIYIDDAWVRTTNTPITDVVGPVTMGAVTEPETVEEEA